MSDVIMQVQNLGKTYRIQHPGERERYVALRDVIARKCAALFRTKDGCSGPPSALHARPSSSAEDFWALRHVSFEVKQGEVVGIIGRNGAGKSTLLKILSRITEPTEGRARIKGRVASLLEIGTGFHPELTGRENIFLNGAVLGMTRTEIRSKFDEIVSFAEVENFLDTPVKRYSSGMYVRLAFAVAAHLDPDILVVDEVLAVGDVAFQKKCLNKMGDVAHNRGRTILFVSHNMQIIRQLCRRTILLAEGQKLLDGDTDEVIQAYLQTGVSEDSLAEMARIIETFPPDPAFRLRRVDVVQDGRSGTEVLCGKPVEILIEYDVFQEVTGLHVYFMLYDVDGALLFESLHNGDAPDVPTMSPGRYISRATIPADFFASRHYELQIDGGIHRIRHCIPQPTPIRIPLNVSGGGKVNQGYPGYATPGKIAPLFKWQTDPLS